jgi:hypothetical protein
MPLVKICQQIPVLGLGRGNSNLIRNIHESPRALQLRSNSPRKCQFSTVEVAVAAGGIDQQRVVWREAHQSATPYAAR